MPRKFNIAVANQVVGITSMFDSTFEFCQDYITETNADFFIEILPEDIVFERDRSIIEAIAAGKEPVSFPEAYLETLAVYRKIATKLIDYDVLLFHGSVIAVDGSAYLFAAPSGVGKSTHSRLWRECFGERAVIVNDDKPLLRILENDVIAYGTPWNGKHHLGNNVAVPLKAIAILSQDKSNSISKIDKKAAFPTLFRQSFHPDNVEVLLKVLNLVDRLGDEVELYQLRCNTKPEAAWISYQGMNESEINY